MNSQLSKPTHRNQNHLPLSQGHPDHKGSVVRAWPLEPLASPKKSQILNSWKEIAAYMGRGVRTVQRWESQLGLPVHRPRGTNRSAVVAIPRELDDWIHGTPVHSDADLKEIGNDLLQIAQNLKILGEQLAILADQPKRLEAEKLASAVRTIMGKLTLLTNGDARGNHSSGPSLVQKA